MNELKINNELFKKTNISTYFASDHGRIANIKFDDNDNVISFKIIKQDISSSGYCRVPLKIEKGIEIKNPKGFWGKRNQIYNKRYTEKLFKKCARLSEIRCKTEKGLAFLEG